MDEPDARDFAEMAAQLGAEPTVEETLARVLEYAMGAVGCDYAGLLMVRSRRVESAAVTDPIVERADQLQMQHQEGPCLESIWQHEWFLIDDTATDPRWPKWGPAVCELGIRSALSTRLAERGRAFGALNLFARETGRFDADDASVGQIFGRHASVALANARQEANLAQAIDARHLIGQAQGILMERFALDADQAFAVLRRYSQNHNIKLRDVARRVVDTRRLPDSTGH
jgi:GAF domain-containing protein